MRGKADTSKSVFCSNRITPAYAGKSSILLAGIQMVWDHPRLCGEKFAGIGRGGRWTGSPPPMRGKAFCQRRNYMQLGDHPRLCGEKGIPVFTDSICTGITPAYAGKSKYLNAYNPN